MEYPLTFHFTVPTHKVYPLGFFCNAVRRFTPHPLDAREVIDIFAVYYLHGRYWAVSVAWACKHLSEAQNGKVVSHDHSHKTLYLCDDVVDGMIQYLTYRTQTKTHIIRNINICPPEFRPAAEKAARDFIYHPFPIKAKRYKDWLAATNAAVVPPPPQAAWIYHPGQDAPEIVFDEREMARG